LPYSIHSNGVAERTFQILDWRLRDLSPAARRFGEWVVREARRNAPVGKGRQRGALKRSLNHVEPAHNVTQLVSPLPYAVIQQEGGTIRAGSGPLGSQYLVIPLNATARVLLDGLGASESLRSVPELQLIRSRKGRLLLIWQETLKRSRRTRGRRRQHRLSGRQILFVLVPQVTLRAQPYAPALHEPRTRERAVHFLRRHLEGK